MYQQILLEASRGGSMTGAMGDKGVQELMKALEAGNQASNVGLTGGAALRVQNLDKTLQATIIENKHFALFNRLPKPKVGGTIDEWTEQSGIGGFLGGSTNTEAGRVRSATGKYARRHGEVKFLMTRREVTLAAELQQGIASAEGLEQASGAKQLLQDAEYLCFEGDANVVPTEFSGIFAQIKEGVAEGKVDPGNIVDVDGKSITDFLPLASAAAQIASRKNFGTPTDLFMSMQVQADLDSYLLPQYRVSLSKDGNDVSLGAPVSAIRTSAGNIKTTQDVLLRDETDMKPFELEEPQIAAANAGMKPAGLTVEVVPGAVDSRFYANRAGTYYYAVASQSAAGQTQVVISDAVVVAQGDSVKITINRSAGQEEDGYVIYRSRQDGTDNVADFREMLRIPKANAATTVHVDLNRDLPGATKACILNMTKGDTAILWRSFLPHMKFNLYPTDSPVNPWLQLLWGYLRISKLRHHAILTNIVTRHQVWRPHKGE